VLGYHLSLYSERLRRMGFMHVQANDWGSVWVRPRDGATAVMRRSTGFIPALCRQDGRRFTADEVVCEHLMLRNESLEDVA
jgi:hypothetical protein